jgi:hypothetical protein
VKLKGDIMNIEFIERNVSATLEIEGLKVSKVGKSITRKFLEGNISSDEAIKKIKEYHLNKGGVTHV